MFSTWRSGNADVTLSESAIELFYPLDEFTVSFYPHYEHP